MEIFNNPENLKKLKGFSDLILEFNLEKYNLFKEISKKYGWDNVYTQDVRYDLLRMVIMDCHIEKGFFTMNDLINITDLNIRSIERFLTKSVQVGYFEKKPFDEGTDYVLGAVRSNKNKNFFSVAGGGDTISILNKVNCFNDFSFVSTGGGAFLEFVQGASMPGLTSLNH